MNWYRIVLPYAVFAVVVDEAGVVTIAAPIGRWMRSKRLTEVTRWVRGKGGTVEEVRT